MKNKLELVWNNLISYAEGLKKSNDCFCIREEMYEEFESAVNKMYIRLLERAMQPDVVYLDRHKVSAIIIVVLINLKVIYIKEGIANSNAELPYQLAISTGLSYMLYELNHERLNNGKNVISRYIFPKQMFGEANCCENIVRMLYLTKDNLSDSILLLSCTLFMIEAFTLVSIE